MYDPCMLSNRTELPLSPLYLGWAYNGRPSTHKMIVETCIFPVRSSSLYVPVHPFSISQFFFSVSIAVVPTSRLKNINFCYGIVLREIKVKHFNRFRLHACIVQGIFQWVSQVACVCKVCNLRRTLIDAHYSLVLLKGYPNVCEFCCDYIASLACGPGSGHIGHRHIGQGRIVQELSFRDTSISVTLSQHRILYNFLNTVASVLCTSQFTLLPSICTAVYIFLHTHFVKFIISPRTHNILTVVL